MRSRRLRLAACRARSYLSPDPSHSAWNPGSRRRGRPRPASASSSAASVPGDSKTIPCPAS
eukprot:11941897-Alexandrium_andersonii.AAC.1